MTAADNRCWAAQERVRAGQALEIVASGDEEAQSGAGGTDLESQQDEESGNQWLYSCVMCGDGGDVAMCDSVRALALAPPADCPVLTRPRVCISAPACTTTSAWTRSRETS